MISSKHSGSLGSGRSRLFPNASSSRRTSAGLEDVLDESCGGDVADELAPEFDDNPGTTRGMKRSRCELRRPLLFPLVETVIASLTQDS